MDALCALHDYALGISPVTSYSGVKAMGMHVVQIDLSIALPLTVCFVCHFPCCTVTARKEREGLKVGSFQPVLRG